MAEDKVLHIEIRTDARVRRDRSSETAGNKSAQSRSCATPVSASQLMRLISGRNVELLRLIKTRQPRSVSELARMSGRPKASLTRTLQRMVALGIVVLRDSGGREKIPVVVCDRLHVELALKP